MPASRSLHKMFDIVSIMSLSGSIHLYSIYLISIQVTGVKDKTDQKKTQQNKTKTKTIYD